MPVIRLFPHKIEGEGHFLALLRKKCADGSGNEGASHTAGSGKVSAEVRRLEKESDFCQWEAMLTRSLDRSRMIDVYKRQILRGSKNLKDAKACLMNGDISKIQFKDVYKRQAVA